MSVLSQMAKRQGAGLAVAGLFLLLALWPQPDFAELNSPNPRVRIYLTRAIVDDHSLQIDGPINRYGNLSDKSRRAGHYYCDKAPGLSLMAVPLYRAMRGVWEAQEISTERLLAWTRAIFVVGLGALSLLLLDLWLLLLGIGRRARLAALAALAGGSLLLPYSLEAYGHVPAAFFVLLSAFLALAPEASALVIGGQMGGNLALRTARTQRQAGAWIGAGMAGGLAVLTEYPTLFLVAPILGIAWWASGRGQSVAERLRAALWIVVGGAGPGLVFLLYNNSAFGGPLTTGYAFIDNPYFHKVHEQGYMGLAMPRLEAFVGSFFLPQRGLFFAAPWSFFAPLGAWLLWKKQRATAVMLVVNVVVYALFVSSFSYWIGGWALGQRHLTPIMPFLALGLGVLMQALDAGWSRWQRWAQVGLSALIVVAIVQISAACLTMPTFAEEFINPFFELSLRLWRLRMFPYSLGTALGLSDGWGQLPAIVAALTLAVLALGAAGPAHLPTLVDLRQRWLATLPLVLWLGLMPLIAQGSAASEHRFEWIVDTVWEPRADLPAKLGDPVKVLPKLRHNPRPTPLLLRHLARHLAAQGDNTGALELLSRAQRLERGDGR